MAVRTDVVIDWVASPRIIRVLAPSTAITIQELVDTCRFHEMDICHMDDDSLIDVQGKSPIDPSSGLYTGLTANLRNAVVSFAARPGPAWAICRVSGGNLTAQDALGNYIDPRLHEPFTSIDVEKSTSAALVEGSGGSTPAQVAAAVWDEPTAGHAVPGSAGRMESDTYNAVLDVYNMMTYLADLAEDLHDEALGKWALNPKTSTLTLFRADGSVLQAFKLKTAVGDVPPYVERAPQP